VSRSAFLNCSHCCSHSGRLRQSCSRECIIITTFVVGQDYYRLSFFLCSLCSKLTVPHSPDNNTPPTSGYARSPTLR
jgi:hypothetical protein